MTNLYKIDVTGGIRVWGINTYGNQVVITHGQLNGVSVTDSYTTEGKNIGRSNETTPEEQAELEAESRIKAQKRLGYYETIGEAKQASKKFKAMKVDKAIDYVGNVPFFTKHFYNLPDEILWSIKLRGVWCAISHDGYGNVVFRSRGNTTFDIMNNSRIAQEVMDTLLPNVIYIGEIYNHNYDETVVAGAVKTKTLKKDSIDLDTLYFGIFDTYDWDTDLTYVQRLSVINGMCLRSKAERIFAVAAVITKRDETIITDILNTAVNNGYEGLVIRDPNFTYDCGKRSKKVIKVKWAIFEDHKLLDIEQNPNNNAIVFVFDGFKAQGNMTHEQQQEYYDNKDFWVGKMAELKGDEYTSSGLLKFPKVVNLFDKDIKN